MRAIRKHRAAGKFEKRRRLSGSHLEGVDDGDDIVALNDVDYIRRSAVSNVRKSWMRRDSQSYQSLHRPKHHRHRSSHHSSHGHNAHHKGGAHGGSSHGGSSHSHRSGAHSRRSTLPAGTAGDAQARVLSRRHSQYPRMQPLPIAESSPAKATPPSSPDRASTKPLISQEQKDRIKMMRNNWRRRESRVTMSTSSSRNAVRVWPYSLLASRLNVVRCGLARVAHECCSCFFFLQSPRKGRHKSRRASIATFGRSHSARQMVGSDGDDTDGSYSDVLRRADISSWAPPSARERTASSFDSVATAGSGDGSGSDATPSRRVARRPEIDAIIRTSPPASKKYVSFKSPVREGMSRVELAAAARELEAAVRTVEQRLTTAEAEKVALMDAVKQLEAELNKDLGVVRGVTRMVSRPWCASLGVPLRQRR